MAQVGLVVLAEVVLGLNGVSVHGAVSGLPVGGANLTVLISKLEGLEEAKGLINGATNGGLVENHVANDTVGADQERGTKYEGINKPLASHSRTAGGGNVPKSVASLLVEGAILLRDLLGEISNKRDGDTTDTALLARSVDL